MTPPSLAAPLRFRWLHLLPRWGLAALLTAAALPKLADPSAFAGALENYRLFSPAASYAVALLLPPLELVIAIALLAAPLRLRRGAWLLSLALFAGFFAITLGAQLRGLDIACGCFGGQGRIQTSDLLLRACFFITAVWGACRDEDDVR